MTSEEEELIFPRQENRLLREQASEQRDLISGLQKQITVLERERSEQQQQFSQLSEQVKALQERLAKDSHNSHLPPSSDRFGRHPKSLRQKSGKKSGGQPGHPGTTLQWSSTPDEIIEQPVERCEACQHDLQVVDPCGRERRQVVDVPSPRLLVREYRAEHKQCPQCHHITVAKFPHGVAAPIQYGTTMGAIAVYLTQQQLLPLARACEVMADLLGIQMSEGTVGELIKRCAHQLAPVEQQIKETLKEAAVLHQDETGVDVGGKRDFLHVTCTPTLTHYHVDVSRGQPA